MVRRMHTLDSMWMFCISKLKKKKTLKNRISEIASRFHYTLGMASNKIKCNIFEAERLQSSIFYVHCVKCCSIWHAIFF